MPWLNLPTVPFTEEEVTLAARGHLTRGDAGLDETRASGVLLRLQPHAVPSAVLRL